ncbi:copper chaperone PCu(A)C [Luteimonas terricola]|nr:copper chaperone PCu(A)C [Luteimonas terricola]
MGILLRILLPAALLCAATAGASASDATAAVDADVACVPRVVDGWLRSPPMPMPMMAGFARIENRCAADTIVIGARSDAFASVELHETQVVDGVSRMREVAELPVAAGGEVVLRPGGLHLMLMRPVSPLATGDVARVEFTLADGRSVGTDFEVRAADAR